MKNEEIRGVLSTMRIFFKTKKALVETRLTKIKRELLKLKRDVIFEEDNIKSLDSFIKVVTKISIKKEEGSSCNKTELFIIRKFVDVFRAILKVSIEELKLSRRTLDALKSAGINTIGNLVKKTSKELLKIKWIGNKAVKMIKRSLWGLGLKLKD